MGRVIVVPCTACAGVAREERAQCAQLLMRAIQQGNRVPEARVWAHSIEPVYILQTRLCCTCWPACVVHAGYKQPMQALVAGTQLIGRHTVQAGHHQWVGRTGQALLNLVSKALPIVKVAALVAVMFVMSESSALAASEAARFIPVRPLFFQTCIHISAVCMLQCWDPTVAPEGNLRVTNQTCSRV